MEQANTRFTQHREMQQQQQQQLQHQQQQILRVGCENVNGCHAHYHISSNSDTGQSAVDHAHNQNNRPIKTGCYRKTMAFLIVSAISLVVICVGVVTSHNQPMDKGSNFRSGDIRIVSRTVHRHHDLPKLNSSYVYLLAKLQSTDSRDCGRDLRNCQETVLCESGTGQTDICRCPMGYYYRDKQCKACSVCDKTQYVAVPCGQQADTICVDVSFPLGILPMDKFYLPDDGTKISLSYSPNVFVERLINMESLETPMYVTNNQQSLDFVWPRISGLDIAVSISDVYLVPDYDDMEAVDDTALFHRLLDPSQKMKYFYNYIQSHHCRHPVPDYYSIQMEVIANRTSTAQVVRCDSQDETLAKCPGHYKDGDRYLKWNINTPCPNFKTTKLTPLKDGPNSVVCTEETDLLRNLFHGVRSTTQEYMFPSRDCEMYRRQCDQCLMSATCPVSSRSSNESHTEDNQCCGIGCYTQTSCKRTYLGSCPQPTVECATGDINIFSLFPHFDSMDRQFACHLKYVPPQQLYTISYVIKIPSINFNTTSQHFTVVSNSRMEHERRLSQFDFITAFHDTRVKIEDELILIGDHNELKHHQESLMKPYKIRGLKTSAELRKEKPQEKSINWKAVYVQFEKPFLYSSFSWYRDGCHKNMSQIYPNQTIYKDDFTPVIARKGHTEVTPETSFTKSQGFTYRLYHRDRAPYVKFLVEKGKSVLQHLQGTSVKGKLVAGSLFGRVAWHNETATWKLVFSATQDECPSVISIKIFTRLSSSCVGHFDILINCPLDFTVTFNFTSSPSDLPDIFILQINDSSTSHNMILSSLYSPSHLEHGIAGKFGHFQTDMSSTSSKSGQIGVWIAVIIILIATIIFLIVNCVVFKYTNNKLIKDGVVFAGNSEGQNFMKEGGKVIKTRKLFCVSWIKYYTYIFVLLYIIYSFLFTFSLAFAIIYFSQSSIWSGISNPDDIRKVFQAELNKSIHDIEKAERIERSRLFASFSEKTTACLNHLNNEQRKQVEDYEETTRKQLDLIFSESGTAHYLINEIQKRNFSIYLSHIQGFVAECNRTVISIVERFQANFFLFIQKTVHNDWLKVPRQIFLEQDGENPTIKYLSSTQVKQFASWLEIDKAGELFVAKENVFGRISIIPPPEVSAFHSVFPPLSPRTDLGEPDQNHSEPSHFYTVLDPLFHNFENLPSSPSVQEVIPGSNLTSKTEIDAGNLSKNNMTYRTRKRGIFAYNSEDIRAIEVDSQARNIGLSENGASYTTNIGDSHSGNSISGTKGLHIVNLKVGSRIEKEPPPGEMIPPPTVINSLNPEPDSKNNINFYILITTFLIFDVVMLIYRFMWLRNHIHSIRHGYPEKIPSDEVCKQLLEIQTGQHLPSPDEHLRMYLNSNHPVYSPSTATSGVIFLRDIHFQKSRHSTLQDIWTEKAKADKNPDFTKKYKYSWIHKFEKFTKQLYQIFLSNLIWQGAVTVIVIIFICLIIYCSEYWLTSDNFHTLVGGRSTVADVQWQLSASQRYLQAMATRLTVQLQQVKEISDFEVQVLTDMYYRTFNTQTTMFTAILQRLCREARGNNCEKLIANHSTGERIVGCNFLPLQVQTFQDITSARIEAVIAAELTPLLDLCRHTLMVSASLLVFLVCLRLICQTTTSLLRHYLLLTDRLPRFLIYQSEKVQIHAPGEHSNMLQRSQSWVDSCESGVYLGETEDTNRDDNR